MASILPAELADLMWLYARRGVAEWGSAPAELRRRAVACLGADIADHEAEAAITLSTVYNGENAKQLRFIPMLRHPKKPGIEQAFFLPVCEMVGGSRRVAFELFLLVQAKNCLAYRFEPAHRSPSAHDYGHVQMSRQLLRKTIVSSTLPWIPDRYPAHPLGTSDPLRMFLSMTTAVHGYSGGVLKVFQEIFTAASRARDVGPYVDELKKTLF